MPVDERGSRRNGVQATAVGLALLLAACAGGGTRDPTDLPVDVAGDVAVPEVPGDLPGDADAPADADTLSPADVAGFDGSDDPGAAPDACIPDCADRECGPDGCGGTCGPGCGEPGWCSPTTFCDEASGRCAQACCWANTPTEFGSAAALATAEIPADGPFIEARCFDLDGDGVGDNGARVLDAQGNPRLADALAAGTFVPIFEWKDGTGGACEFGPLTILFGQADGTASTPPGYVVLDESYASALCSPVYVFCDATIAGGRLAFGPVELPVSIPIEEGVVVNVTLVQARLVADVPEVPGPDGFRLENGILSGVLTKGQLQAGVDQLQALCDAAPEGAKPEFCATLQLSFLAGLPFDLHEVRDAEGGVTYVPKSKEAPGDALSVCFSFTASPARIVGPAPHP